MKIQFGNISEVEFSEIDMGETFQYFDEIYIRCSGVFDEDGELQYNSVNLGTGCHEKFYPNTKVTPVGLRVEVILGKK